MSDLEVVAEIDVDELAAEVVGRVDLAAEGSLPGTG
jgi:hypothetical protein